VSSTYMAYHMFWFSGLEEISFIKYVSDASSNEG